MTPSDDVKGEPTTSESGFWRDVGSRMDPEKAVERLDIHGKYLFSIVSVVSGLLTGFGIYSPQLSSVFRNPLIFLPVCLLAFSLMLAMIGITPQIKDVERFNIVSIKKYYRFQVLWRGWFIRLAGGAFALAILSAALVLASMAHAPISPMLAFELSGKGDQRALIAKVELERLPQDVEGDIRVLGFAGPATNPQPQLIFHEVSPIGAGGKLTSSIRLDRVQKFSRFRMEVQISSGTRNLYTNWAEISCEP